MNLFTLAGQQTASRAVDVLVSAAGWSSRRIAGELLGVLLIPPLFLRPVYGEGPRHSFLAHRCCSIATELTFANLSKKWEKEAYREEAARLDVQMSDPDLDD